MTWGIQIENIAGIRDGAARIRPGVNAIQASNWQGKSSLLAAIKTVMGATTPLTEGQDYGQVELATEEETYVIELVRENGTISRRGESYLTDDQDRICADLFAFLDDVNEIRRAVRDGENLEEVLTRPLDFENIDEQIAELRHEREQAETELERAEEAARKLPSVEERIAQLEDERDQLREERKEFASSAESDQITDTKRDELSDARAERERVQNRIERLEETIEQTRERLEDRRDELDELSVPDESDIESELAEARSDLRDVERDIELLRSVYEANKRIFDENRVELLTTVEHGLGDDTIGCWVCGNKAERTDFDEQLAELGDRITALQSDAKTYREKAENLESRRDTIAEKQRRQRDLELEVADLEATLDDRKESLGTARNRLGELEDRITELSEVVDERDDRLTDIESELKYTETELEEAREELESLESRANQREMLENEVESLTSEIEELRTRRENIKQGVREAFDEAIQAIVDRFDVSFETARLTGSFDLVVARDRREASLDALSEGERELLGIVAALAGYEAYEVQERLPIMLLDGIGGLASENLHTLVDYLSDHTEYLVLTTYPEHEGFEGNELDPGQWTVVSDEDGLAVT